MDTRGRGRAGEADPADQWVFNPDTGSYELRLPSPSRPHAPGGHPGAPSPGHAPEHPREPRLPGQRRRTGPPPAGPQRPRSRRKPKPRKSGKQKALAWTGGTVAVLVLAGGAGAYWVYQELSGNIDKVDVGVHNAAVTKGPVNILVIGTDTRSGKGNAGYGDKGNVGHADTTILFHFSEDRSNATALSIPRDLVTDIPDCRTKAEDGTWRRIPGSPGVQFNQSLGQAGRDPGCTWKTVEQLTGLKVHHFMMADFNAVKELSTAVDGVEVCLAKDIDDPKSHLKLSAGRHTIEGDQALAFVRTRYSVGFGSDLSRIELQQQFLSSMIRKVKSSGTLTSPKKLWQLSQAATKALTVDTGIGSPKSLMDLAKDLSKVNQKHITFVTVPVSDNPENKATVILDEAKASPLFKMMRADNSLTATKKKPPERAVEKAEPDEIRVDVLNGGADGGSAQATLKWLQVDKGIAHSTNAGNAAGEPTDTRLDFARDQAPQARALADIMGLPKTALHRTESGTADAMVLTLGKDFDSPGTPIEAPTEAPEGVQNVNADDKDVCAK